MACGYCGNHNDAADSRCQLCGRRLTGASLTIVPESHGSAAPKLERHAHEEPKAEAKKTAVQGRLFPVQEPKKVIPFDRVSPAAMDAGRKVIEKNAKSRALQRAAERMGLNGSSSKENQQVFAFPHDEKDVRKAETVRYTEAPVAGPSHRAMAAAFDIGMVLIACGILALVNYFGGGSFGWTQQDQYTYLALAVSIFLLYFSLFAIGNGDTPGMHAVRIRLLNLDGRAPSRKQRFLRIVGTLVSLSALGIGLLWCLFDEEKLTWHDEISGTFPSPLPTSTKVS